MAKLKAHGQELFRLVRLRTDLDEKDTGPLGFKEHREEISFRSDGHILRKHWARWKDTGRPQDWGWKLWKKTKAKDADGRHAAMTAYRDVLLVKGWILQES